MLPSEDEHRRDHLDQESDCTSDSNDEFASASEGDDDLPWEPVVIRSPVIPRSSPLLTAHQQPVSAPDRDSAATPTPSPAQVRQMHQHHQHQHQHHHHHQQREEEHHRQVQGHPSQLEQQPQQQQYAHQPSGLIQSQQPHGLAQQQTPGQHQPVAGSHGQWSRNESSSTHQHQAQFRGQMQTHSQHTQFSSSSSSSSSGQAQISPNQPINRGAPPKLRERMRHSPVPHSRIVKAYLDPHAVTSAQQQHQLTSETIRQAWLQDQQDTYSSQESSEDEVDKTRANVHPQPAPQHVLPVQAHQTPVQSVRSTAMESSSHPVQHQQARQDTAPPRTRPFSPPLPATSRASFEAPVTQSTIQQQQQPPAMMHQAASDNEEAASGWSFDDELEDLSPIEQTVDRHQVHQQIPTLPMSHVSETQEIIAQESNISIIQRHVPSSMPEPLPLVDLDESWGFDDNIVIEEPDRHDILSSSVEPHLQHQENDDFPQDHVAHEDTIPSTTDAWDYDGQHLELAEPHQPAETTPLSSEPLIQQVQPEAESYPHIHTVHEDADEGGDAWGHDDDLDIDIEGAPADYETFNLGTPDPSRAPDAVAAEEVAVEEATSGLGNAVAGDASPVTPSSHGIDTVEVFQEELYPQETVVEEASWGLDNTVTEEILPEVPTSHEIDTTTASEEEIYHTQEATPSNIDLNAEEPIKGLLNASLGNAGDDDVQQQETLTSGDRVPTEPEEAFTQEHVYAHDAIIDFGDFEQEAGAEDAWGYDDLIVQDVQPVHEEEHQHLQEPEPLNAEPATKSYVEEADDISHMTEQSPLTRSHEPDHPAATESDNEHDTEVQKVLRVSTSETFSDQDKYNRSEAMSGTPSSASTGNQQISDNSTVRDNDNVEHLEHDHSDLQPLLMRDQLPVFIDGSSRDTPLDQSEVESLEDSPGLRSHQHQRGFDSEGSDIYDDLSTARSGMNTSSNRLNEVLDDDDYLEHMERGVPMNRSISTPYSDEEAPKFIVEDDLAELMERGEPRPADGVIRLESAGSTSESETEGLGDDDAEIRGSQEEPGASLDHENSSELDAVPFGQSESSAPEELAQASVTQYSVNENSDIEDTPAEVSDDQDPNNPFGDAAALDDQRSWPDEEQRNHVDQEAEEETAKPSVTATDHQSEPDPVFEEDVWAEQDEIDVAVDPFEAPLMAAAEAYVPEISEEAGGSTSTSSLRVGSIIHHAPVDQQEDIAENTWGWDEDEVGVNLEIQKETPPSVHDGSMTSSETNTTEQASPQTEATITVDPLDLLFEQLEGQSEATPQQASAVGSSMYDASATKTFDVDEFFKEFTEPILIAAPAVLLPVVEHTKEESLGETASQLLEGFGTERDQENDAQQQSFGASLESQIEGDYGADDAWGVDAPWSDFKEQTQESHALEATSVDSVSPIQTDTLPPMPLSTSHEEHAALEESDLMHDNQGLHEHATWTSSTPGQAVLEELDFLPSQHVSVDHSTLGTGPISASNVQIDATVLEADPWDTEEPITHKISTPEPQQIQETRLEEKILESDSGEADAWDEQIDIDISNDILEPMAEVTSNLNVAPDHEEALRVDLQSESEHGVSAEADPWDEPIDGFIESTEDREQGTKTDLWHEPTADETADGLEKIQPEQETPTLISATVEHQDVVSDEKEMAWGFDDGTAQHHYEEAVEAETFAPTVVDSATASMSPHDRLFSDAIHHLQPSLASVVQFSPKAMPASPSAKFAPSSPVFGVRRTDHGNNLQDDRDDDEQDAWDDDGHVLEDLLPQHQGEEDVSAAVQEEVGEIHEAVVDEPLAEAEKMRLEELPEIDTEALDSWGFDMDEEEHADVPSEPTVVTVPSVTAAIQDAGHRTPSPPVTGGLSPLTIRKGSLLVAPGGSGADSSESNDDNASQSPWQDISPASVSKRSEAGMSVGSEFDSEYSVRSLDDDDRHMHAPASTEHDAHQHHGLGSIREDDHKKDGMVSAMSWTDLNQDDDWQDNATAIGRAHLGGEQQECHHFEENAHHIKDISLESSSSKDIGSGNQSAGELIDLPDISGVDSWDFDHDEEDDNEVTKTTTSSLMSQTPTTTRSSMFSRDNLKTPDMSRDIAGTSGLQRKSSFTGSSFTSVSPGGRTTLSSYQSSLAGSVPPSPGNTLHQPTTTATVGANTDEVEVEDDSHLPLAIRQQRARLAAKGKPLPPISKYKSTKSESSSSSSFTATSRDQVLTSPSPRLASATTSPVISFSNPTTNSTTTASGAGNILPVPDQKVLSPALQRQKERLEQKRAAAAAAKKLTAVEATKSTTIASLTSPTLVASTPFTSTAGSSIRSPLPPLASDASKASPASVAAPSASTISPVSDLGQASSRRRGSGAIPGTSPTGVLGSNTSSSSGKIKATTPSSPLSEGFVRRSKDGHRPAGLRSQEHEDEQDSWDQGVVHTSQSDIFRHGVSNKKASRISTSSSGWDHTMDEEDLKERQLQEDQPQASLAKSPSSTAMSKPSTLFSPKTALSTSTSVLATSSSSSFYQQTVPGLDEAENAKKKEEGDKSTLFMKTSSDDKESKILDSEAYDPYGPAASRQQLSPLKTNNRTQKAKSSFEEDRASAELGSHQHHEVLMNSSISSPSGVSLISPTLGGSFSMSHRHDHHRGHASGSHSSNQHNNHHSGGGSGSGSLVGDISSILKEKKTPLSGSDNNSGSNNSQQFDDNDYKGKSVNPMTTSSSSASLAPSRPAPKASGGGWSFGSLLSSAVAVATDTLDKAYESLDPEYSRMKTRGGSTTFSDDGTGTGDESRSTSPFTKPGYVVGGSSLALGLASITTTKSPPSTPAPPPITPTQPSAFSSKQDPGRSKPSFDSFSRPGDSDPEPSDFQQQQQHQHHQHQHHNISTSNTSVSPRMTRKHVDRRE